MAFARAPRGGGGRSLRKLGHRRARQACSLRPRAGPRCSSCWLIGRAGRPVACGDGDAAQRVTDRGGDARQHARKRRAVAGGVVLALATTRRSSASSRGSTTSRCQASAAHGVHLRGHRRRRCLAELERAAQAGEPDGCAVAKLTKTKMPSDAAAGLRVNERVLLFCIASSTDHHRAGVTHEIVPW
jgi:hypothetical protein